MTQKPSPERPAQKEKPPRRWGLALFVFMGSLLGSLLGVAADINDAAETVERFQRSLLPELCVAGSNTILGDGINMAQDWKSAFEETESYNVAIRGVGSVRGVEEAVAGQCVHVLAMSEPMTDSQAQALGNAGVEISCAAEIGYDVIAFVTDINNRVATLQERLLASILTGSVSNWQEIGGANQPIRILARPGSGTTDYVLINAAGYRDPDITDDQYFPPYSGYVPCASNGACLDEVLATPGSLYWVSTAWMRTQPEKYLRVIPVLRGDERPTNPLEQTVNLDEYPDALIRPLYLYVLDTPAASDAIEAEGRKFLNFVRSVRGQQILEQYHFYTFFDRPTEVEIVLPAGFEIGEDGRRSVCVG